MALLSLDADQWIGLLGLLVLVAVLLRPKQDYRRPEDFETPPPKAKHPDHREH